MKRLFLLLLFLFAIQFANAQDEKLAIGLYGSPSHQNVNYVDGSDFLKPNGSCFSGSEFGLLFRYNLNEILSLKLGVGMSQNHVLLNDDFISSFKYNEFPIDLSIKTDLVEKSGFSLFIENGIRVAYCNSFSYNQIINPDNNGFIIEGSIGAYDVTESFSYGLINSIGLSYTFNCGVEIDLFTRYFSGLNKVWENNEIIVKTIDTERAYSINSFGSSLDLGVAVYYNF